MQYSVELEGAQIVLHGSFNPAIFQPSWLETRGLIRPDEAGAVENLVISGEVSSFKCVWFRLQVTKDLFFLEATDPAHFEPIRDLVRSIFSLLEHTPITKMGLNRRCHARLTSEEDWHALGDYFAPKTFWNGILAGRVGLRSLTIQGKREGSQAKAVNIKIEPSRRFTPFGVYMDTNEHYEGEGSESARNLMDILGESWSEALRFSKEMMSKILDRDYPRQR